MKAKKHGSFHQKHSLGQNFIEDETLLEQLADLSLVTSQDCVLEIGPGFGVDEAAASRQTGCLLKSIER
ncbi:MAG: rRNA adenine N-6-methyltransferase family protein [Christensenellales bacterium]